jgi:hypothetical protein
MKTPALALALAFAGCASHYAYTFDVPPLRDADVTAELVVDPAVDAIALALTNRTEQVLQVGWADISVAGANGHALPLRPDSDLGWILPGATVSARLFPLALPRDGDAAAAYEGRRLELTVPVIVRRETRQLHYSLTAHVREL